MSRIYWEFTPNYDAAGRLVDVQTDGIITESYTHDANGNRLTRAGVTATYYDQDRLITSGGTTFGHTAN